MNPLEAMRKLEEAKKNVIPFDGKQIIVAPLEAVEGLLFAVEMLFPDNCEVCKGEKGGVRGNENCVDGKVMCDYCTIEYKANL